MRLETPGSIVHITDASVNCNEVTNPGKLAEVFNTFFQEKVKKLRDMTDQTPLITPASRLRKWLSKRGSPPPPFELKEINSLQFRRILKKIKPKRTHGADLIDSNSLKITGPLLEETFLHLINSSIREGIFAGRWKPQTIFPLHKKNERDLLQNYRPVSHLVQVGLMVEYAVYFQIVDHFLQNDLFNPHHHGSIPNHSTATAIL